ncbi:MAG: glycosyltransferase family 4 protein [Bacillota bacterium]|nr:glycosyltransferase family 4 protein [Bacillota bacterium]
MKSKVIMIGPCLNTQGGISSVLKIYKNNIKDLELDFIASYSGKNRYRDIYFFFISVIKTIIICIISQNTIFHINTASKGSFFRKSILTKICLFFKKKVILHIHGGGFVNFIESSSPHKKRKIISLLNKVNSIIVLSDFWLDSYKKYVPPKKIKVLYNPCARIDAIYIPRGNIKARILFVGKLCKNKGVYDLISAVESLDKESFTLDIYGDGEIENARVLVSSAGLNDNIFIHDWVTQSELDNIYSNTDILALPSYAEGMPMCILEAMGKGIPVVATNVGGIPEAVRDGVNGFIVSPGDIQALADRLNKLIYDRALRERMGKTGLEIANSKFSVKLIIDKLKFIYYNDLYKKHY